jgi:hypothetical protein
MRSTQFGPASSSLKLLPIAVLGLAGLVAGCTPNLEDKLLCQNSTQCPTGYFCAADGKCQQGDSVPEIVVLTQTSGITSRGRLRSRCR